MRDLPELANFLKEYHVKVNDEEHDIIDTIGAFLEYNRDDTAFYIVHFGKIIEQYTRWRAVLPRVKPFYAVKCNPNPAIIQLLKNFNVGFDCASKDEIRMVTSQGVSSENIIFANPCKASNEIKFARSEDIDIMTFDDIHELLKIKLYHPEARLVIRIVTDDSKSECKFSCKFGVEMRDVERVLTTAKSMMLNVVGVSFHVGSNCHDTLTYYNSIRDSRDVFDIAERVGYSFDVLDIGGGFPSHDPDAFESIAAEVNRGIDEFFPSDDINIIAEPGRYFVGSSHTLVANIIGKKEAVTVDGTKKLKYYLNDGVYGSFNCIFFDHAQPKIHPYNERNGILYESKVFGPTCDSIDTISHACYLPDLAIGEWVFVENFGAYTIAAASTFNGFQQTKCVYCI
jgi:diaminopimelate decarboxylase